MRQCQRRFDDCYLQDIIRAIGDSTWVEVEDQIARSEMYFTIVTSLTGAGLNAKGTSTTFNPVLPLTPGQSVLLVQDLTYPVGHIGMFVSGKTQKTLAPKISEWLNERV